MAKTPKKTRVHFTFGRQVTEEDLKKWQLATDALEVRMAEGDHEHHSDHSAQELEKA
jgi:hypothetical protein